MTHLPSHEFSSAEILDKDFKAHRPRLSFQGKTREEWTHWRRQLIKELQNVFGPMPPMGEPVNARVLSCQDFDEYTQYKVVYETRPGVPVPAYLLIPKGSSGKNPAVLCVHGHVPGGKEAVVVGGHPFGIPYGAHLAKMGLVTLCPDNAGMGERSHPQGSCDLLWRRLNYLGMDLTGYRVYDLIRSVDYLQSRPEVDEHCIGMAGLSGGCWLSLVATALDCRIQAAVLSGYFTTFAQTSWVGHCICHHPKGIGLICEMPDIAGLIAPRPIFIEWGKEDVERPVHPAFERTQRIYEVAGAPDHIVLHEFDGPHLFCGDRSLPWLLGVLREMSYAKQENTNGGW